jgi:pimeloyl-ACP methyl ester carboxylesterase
LSHRDQELSRNTPPNAALDSGRELLIEERFIPLDAARGSARMRYLKAGSGPSLLLVHGLLGYSFSWRFATPVLAQHATVYAVDLLGAGFSDRPAGLDCSLRANAERLLCFMDATGLNSCDLLGTSHGGAVAMMTAALAPDRIQRLILVAPVNPWSAHGKRLTVFLNRPLIAPWLLYLAPRLPSLQAFFHRRMFADPRHMPADSLEGYRKPMNIPGSWECALSVTRSWNRDLEELESVLLRIAHIPTLLIWGNSDGAVYPSSAVALKRRFNNCRLVTFDGVGHLPYEEVPEEFNRTVIEFLS